MLERSEFYIKLNSEIKLLPDIEKVLSFNLPTFEPACNEPPALVMPLVRRKQPQFVFFHISPVITEEVDLLYLYSCVT